jgi:hypothetical protein
VGGEKKSKRKLVFISESLDKKNSSFGLKKKIQIRSDEASPTIDRFCLTKSSNLPETKKNEKKLKLKNVSKMFFAQSRSQRVTPGSASG